MTRTPFSPLTRAFSTQNHTIPKHEKIMQNSYLLGTSGGLYLAGGGLASPASITI